MKQRRDTLTPAVEKLITMRELSEYLGIHGSTAYRLVREGAIPHVRIGGAIRFRLSRVIAVLEDSHARK